MNNNSGQANNDIKIQYMQSIQTTKDIIKDLKTMQMQLYFKKHNIIVNYVNALLLKKEFWKLTDIEIINKKSLRLRLTMSPFP